MDKNLQFQNNLYKTHKTTRTKPNSNNKPNRWLTKILKHKIKIYLIITLIQILALIPTLTLILLLTLILILIAIWTQVRMGSLQIAITITIITQALIQVIMEECINLFQNLVNLAKVGKMHKNPTQIIIHLCNIKKNIIVIITKI